MKTRALQTAKHTSWLVAILLALAACSNVNHEPMADRNMQRLSSTSGITVTDLGTLGGSASIAYGINESSAVVGVSLNADDQLRAFLWTEAEGMQDLGTIEGGSWSIAYGINDHGAVVGGSEIAADQRRAFLWSNGEMQDLGTLEGGTRSEARDINNSGAVVGWSDNNDGQVRAFLWTEAVGMHDLGGLGDQSEARGINDSGAVVGASGGRAFLWTEADGMQDLGTLGGNSEAWGINNSGAVVGWSLNADDQPRAFLWTEAEGMQNLGTLGGSASIAWGINDSGVVVGVSENADDQPRAFLWTEEGGMLDLGALGSQSQARDINDSGLVVGWSLDADDQLRATFWTVARHTLRVSKDGDGSGTVTSNPAGINCGDDCSRVYYEGTTVVLTATASPGSTFAGWNGCDSTTSANQCTVTMNGVKNVTATFEKEVVVVVMPSINQNGTVNRTTGVATVSGTVNCSAPVTLELELELSQEQGQKEKTTITGSQNVSINCDGVSVTKWSAEVRVASGGFARGAATATLDIGAGNLAFRWLQSVRLQ